MTAHDIDLVTQWLAARDNEKASARANHGDSPCIPAATLLEVCRRIFSKPTTNP